MLSPDKRNLGRIRISDIVISDTPEIAKQVLRDCIVLHTQALFHENVLEYVIVHDSLDLVKEGGIIPRYDIVITKDDSTLGGFIRKFIKKEHTHE